MAPSSPSWQAQFARHARRGVCPDTRREAETLGTASSRARSRHGPTAGGARRLNGTPDRWKDTALRGFGRRGSPNDCSFPGRRFPTGFSSREPLAWQCPRRDGLISPSAAPPAIVRFSRDAPPMDPKRRTARWPA